MASTTDHIPRRRRPSSEEAAARIDRPGVDGETRETRAPLQSLLASAVRISGKKVKRAQHQKWQDEAWELHDLLGEVRAPAIQFANALSRATFYVAKQPPDDTVTSPEPITEGPAWEVLRSLGGSRIGRSQLVRRIAEQMWVAGESYLVGMVPQALADSEEDVPLTSLRWEVVSGDEVESLTKPSAGRQETILVDEDGNALDSPRLTVRVWRPHPRRWWEADGPIRSSRPVLRELVGLTKYVSAQIDSRLAGAGILAVAQGASVVTGTEETETSLMDALMEAMVHPIEDRSAASSFVPLLLEIAGDDASKAMHWIRFASELDDAARELRDEAIRRWALGADLPPELLLGMSEANHWTSWLIREETVTTHLEPMLALIADALTTQYLWPVLEEMGEPDAREWVVWFDSSVLTQRPNRADAAGELYDRGELTGAALRREAGFDEEDAPPELTAEQRALSLVMEMVQGAPSLAGEPGIPELVRQMREVIAAVPTTDDDGDGPADVDPEQPDDVSLPEGDEDGTPDTLPEGGQPAPTDGEPAGIPASIGVRR